MVAEGTMEVTPGGGSVVQVRILTARALNRMAPQMSMRNRLRAPRYRTCASTMGRSRPLKYHLQTITRHVLISYAPEKKNEARVCMQATSKFAIYVISLDHGDDHIVTKMHAGPLTQENGKARPLTMQSLYTSIQPDAVFNSSLSAQSSVGGKGPSPQSMSGVMTCRTR